jgi:hypothetical protein
MKPAISADGFSTERTSRERSHDQPVSTTFADDVVIQRLVPNPHERQMSIRFLGVFSHAVRKRPRGVRV